MTHTLTTRWIVIPTLLALAMMMGCQGFSVGKSADQDPVGGGTLTVTPNSLNFNNVQTGTNQSLTVMLSNNNTSSVTVTQASVTGAGFSSSGLSLPLTLTAGQSTTFQVVFSPSATGGVAGTLDLTTGGSATPISISLLGNGIASGSISTSPNSFNFGNVAVGGRPSKTETITNTGGTPVTISNIGATGAFAATSPQMPLTLNPGQSVSFPVFFGPVAQGATTGVLAITISGMDTPVDVALSGTGVAPGTLGASPASFTFSGVQSGSNQTQTETLTNSGGTNVDISSISASGTGFSVSGLSLPVTLTPGQSATFSVKFAPQSSGNFSGSVTVSSDATNPTLSIPLSGSVPTAAALTATPSSFTFSNVTVGQNSIQTETLKNTGGTSASVSAVSTTGTGFSTSGITPPVTIGPGQSVTFNVVFAPASAGTFTGNIAVTSNASNPNVSIGLTATSSASASPATITTSPSSFTFTNITVGQNSTQTETLTNTGGTSASVSAVSATGTGFSVTGITTPVTLTPGQSVTFNVKFAPTSAGTFTGSVAVTSNASNPNVSIGLSGSSVAATQNTLSTGAVAVGSVTVGTNGTATGTLTASGGNVTVSGVTLGGSNASEFAISGISFPKTVAPGTPVNFTVTFTPSATGAASATASFASNASNSPAVASLSGTGAAAPVHTVKLNWTASTTSDVSSYNIYRATVSGGNCGSFSVYDSTSGSTTTYTDQTVTDGTSYCYATTAVDPNGESALSNAVQVSVPAP